MQGVYMIPDSIPWFKICTFWRRLNMPEAEHARGWTCLRLNMPEAGHARIHWVGTQLWTYCRSKDTGITYCMGLQGRVDRAGFRAAPPLSRYKGGREYNANYCTKGSSYTLNLPLYSLHNTCTCPKFDRVQKLSKLYPTFVQVCSFLLF